MKSLMRRGRPKYEWIKNSDGRMARIQVNVLGSLDNEERRLYNNAKLPASRDILKANVARLMMNKQFHDEADKATLIIKEWVDYMEVEKVTEYEAWGAINCLLTNDKSDFFPPLSRLANALREIRGLNF